MSPIGTEVEHPYARWSLLQTDSNPSTRWATQIQQEERRQGRKIRRGHKVRSGGRDGHGEGLGRDKRMLNE